MLGLLVLGSIDIIAGVMLLFNINGGPALYIGIFMLLKGIFSVISGAASEFYFDLPGILDIIGGILIVLISAGIFLEFFVYFGLVIAIKGAYSLITGIISS